MTFGLVIFISIWICGVALYLGRPFFRGRWQLLPLLGLFGLTAVFGSLISYDPDRAVGKLLILLAGIALFVAIVRLPANRLNQWFLLLGGVAAGVAIYFLLTNSWRQWPADVRQVQQLGLWWMQVRPAVGWPPMHPNFAGGIIAVFAPLLVARAWLAWRQQLWPRLGVTLVVGMVASVGLFLTSSRAAMLSLLAGFGLWGMGGLFSWLGQFRRQLPLLAWGGTAVLLLIGGVAALIVGLNPVRFGQLLPGMDSTGSRLFLVRETLHLLGDFPIIGGGLASYPGIFSQYTMVIPSFFFDYSHNLYLDLLFEQGILGFVSLLLLMLIPAGRLFVHTVRLRLSLQQRVRNWSILAGLATLLLHGLVDDALYGGVGTPLLFALPSLAVAATRIRRTEWLMAERPFSHLLQAGGAIVLLGFIFLFQPLRQQWLTNWHNVAFARLQLADFPTDEWSWGEHVEAFAFFEPKFAALSEANENNRAAWHRLGFLALNRGEYETAVVYLEKAHQLDADHRGIRKLLGYSYTWLGEPEKGQEQLLFISESQRELFIYSGWWEAQGRADLAVASRAMARQLPRSNR